jgi:two-component system LytT family response regulator
MNAIIVDDEKSNIENLTLLLHKYCPQINLLGTATEIDTATAIIIQHKPDLLFLDIQLGKQSGFDLLRLLPNKNFEVVFITAFDKYGIEAIKFAALDYLLKPVAIPELILAVNKAEEKMLARDRNQQLTFLLSHINNDRLNPRKIALQQQHEIRYVDVADIVRCEADNSYTSFYLISGDRIVVSRSIKEYTDLLKPIGFLRTHQSHIVNIIYIKSWIKEDGGALLLVTGDKVPVSKPNKTSVQLALNKSVF